MGDPIGDVTFEMTGSLPGSEEDRGNKGTRVVTFQATWPSVESCGSKRLDVSLGYVLHTGGRTGTPAKVTFCIAAKAR